LSIESGSQNKQQPAQIQQPATINQAREPPITNGHTTTSPVPAGNKHRASRFPKALEIIAEESGLSLADLTESTVFADVGIDSLLNLTISARFKEEIDVDMDFSALLQEYPTVVSLKDLLAEPETDTNGILSAASSKAETYPSSKRVANGHITNGNATNGHATNGHAAPPGEVAVAEKPDFQRALKIISEESGVATEELTADTNFTDAGIDSLLSLIIVSRFRNELDLEIQHESLLMDYPSVADLKGYLLPGDPSPSENRTERPMEAKLSGDVSLPPSMKGDDHLYSSAVSLSVRKKAVDHYVQKYTAGFHAPMTNCTVTKNENMDDSKVLLVTGASGSLGGHLVDQLAQRDDVKTVICLNRVNNAEPYARQRKAMRDRGIRSFDKIRRKLLVLQTDSSKPMFGLSECQYEELVHSVTHLIHNAWPMSAKRQLGGFESQFQVLRNLIDFACRVTSCRPASFKFSFQMVSSIGVVGHHGLSEPNSQKKIVVPEGRVDIDSVLPNGYGEAKWVCERMLDETLHKHYADRIRTMVVRLGQIAGSKRCGYWNPTEHFAFLIKSSQTLNALPDVPGMLYWTPVEEVAGALLDLVLGDNTPYPVYHIENPIGQPWHEMNMVLADALNIQNLIPFEKWAERVRHAPHKDNPAALLSDFFIENYLRMSCGGLVLDVKNTLQYSRVLSGVGPVSEEVVKKYIHVWREIGFLK
jgi:acyl carrier protein/nucleoside-diphosphate-sugar epimerase